MVSLLICIFGTEAWPAAGQFLFGCGGAQRRAAFSAATDDWIGKLSECEKIPAS